MIPRLFFCLLSHVILGIYKLFKLNQTVCHCEGGTTVAISLSCRDVFCQDYLGCGRLPRSYLPRNDWLFFYFLVPTYSRRPIRELLLVGTRLLVFFCLFGHVELNFKNLPNYITTTVIPFNVDALKVVFFIEPCY